MPDLPVLAPSERYAQQRKRRQLIRHLRRWLPDRYLVVVADSSYAVVTLLSCAVGLNQPVTMITRLRLDAGIYERAPERKAGTIGRPRRKGARQLTLAQRLVDPQTVWQTLTGPWYGGQTYTVVCLAVETGSHLSRSPCAPGSGDAATMVRSGHPAHDARVVGALFAGDTVRPGVACRRASARSPLPRDLDKV